MAEEDWTFVPKVVSNKWQEEEDDEIKENWDDEDEDEPSKASSNNDSTQQEQPSTTQTSETTKAQKIGKKKSKALKEKIMKKEEEIDRKPLTAEELLAEKLEQQRLVEEGDLALAKETFGITSSGNDASILNSIRLATKDDFDDFRKALDEKLSPFVRSPHYVTFLDNLFRSLASGLETEDIKKLISTLTALQNEKIKLQKQSKGKKGKKNAEIKMERDDDYTYNQYEDEYDNFF